MVKKGKNLLKKILFNPLPLETKTVHIKFPMTLCTCTTTVNYFLKKSVDSAYCFLNHYWRQASPLAGELQLKFRYPNPPKKPPMTQTIIAVKTHPLPSPPAPRALPCGVCRKVRDLDHLGVAHPPPPP